MRHRCCGEAGPSFVRMGAFGLGKQRGMILRIIIPYGSNPLCLTIKKIFY